MSEIDIAGLPAFAFGDTKEANNHALAQVIAGARIASIAPKRDLGPGLEPMPVVGERFVVLDGDGLPGAIIEDVSVQSFRFQDIPDELIKACGADDIGEWKSTQAAYIDKYGGWSPDLEMVCDYFHLVQVIKRP